MINFKDYQSEAMTTAIYPGRGAGNWTYPALGLAGETGEVCEKLKKALRDHGGKIDEERLSEIEKELGDVLWYLSALASELGLELERVAERNLAKLSARRENDRLHGAGDNR